MNTGIDQIGHCVKCHKNLIVHAYVNIDSTGTGELISKTGEKKMYKVKMPSPLYDTNNFALSDGSIMTCCICKNCKSKLTEADHQYIFESVFNGWKAEMVYMARNIKFYPDYKDDVAKSHLESQAQKKILFNTHGLSEQIIKTKFEELRK